MKREIVVLEGKLTQGTGDWYVSEEILSDILERFAHEEVTVRITIETFPEADPCA